MEFALFPGRDEKGLAGFPNQDSGAERIKWLRNVLLLHGIGKNDNLLNFSLNLNLLPLLMAIIISK
jgi:hypothetical protein